MSGMPLVLKMSLKDAMHRSDLYFDGDLSYDQMWKEIEEPHEEPTAMFVKYKGKVHKFESELKQAKKSGIR